MSVRSRNKVIPFVFAACFLLLFSAFSEKGIAEEENCCFYTHVLCAQKYETLSLFQHGDQERTLLAGAVLAEAAADEYRFSDCIAMTDVINNAVKSGTVCIGYQKSSKKVCVFAFDGENRMLVCYVPEQYGEKVKSEWEISYDLGGKTVNDILNGWKKNGSGNEFYYLENRALLSQMLGLADQTDYNASCKALIDFVSEKVNATVRAEDAEAAARRMEVRANDGIKLKNADGKLLVQVPAKKTLLLTGYNEKLEQFSAEYDGKKGYIKASNLRRMQDDKWVDVSEGELKEYFAYTPIRKAPKK